MEVVRRGQRVIFEPLARAWDAWSAREREFQRKVRTLAGNYQLVKLAPWLLTWQNPVLIKFFSHKLLRLASPFLLLAVLLASMALPGLPYRLALWLNLAFYLLAALGLQMQSSSKVSAEDGTKVEHQNSTTGDWLRRAANAAFTFVMLNTAALVALGYFVGRKRGVWIK
jgi:hypothetical protein